MAVLFFGDILQLRPVKARYICEEPISDTYSISHELDPLWKKFDVVFLNKNHRQGEDRAYANILNRIREGHVTDADVHVLESRVRPINHPDIPKKALIVSCTNKEVNGSQFTIVWYADDLKLSHKDQEIVSERNKSSKKFK